MKTPIFRMAPSPTGEVHIGTVGMALVNYMLAKSMNGKFLLRIEDTDQKREVEGAADRIIETFKTFDILPDNIENVPYQSKRTEIYQTAANQLINNGLAYMEDGAIRLKCPQNAEPIKWKDLVKGDMVLPPLQRDPVILKSNRIPPYNLAHVIDDEWMGTTHVVRGEEWLPSTAEHIQIYEALHGTRETPWQYCHLPVISIIEDGNKRKLSKRKDKEAHVDHFLSEGYPTQALIEYLLTVYNTDYEVWRTSNPEKDWREFNFRFEKIGSSSPLFDWDKLNSISKNIIAKMSCEQINKEVKDYFDKYHVGEVSEKNLKDIFTLLAVDRGTERPRKDISKYGEILTEFDYVFRPVQKTPLIEKYITLLKSVNNVDDWFILMKAKAAEFGYKNVREFTQALRVALTGRERSTDLYTISKVLLGNL